MMNNNRILELAKQAGIKFSSETALSPQEMKFAELIIKECVSILDDMHLWQSVNNQNYPNVWHDAVGRGIDAINEHFEVDQE